MRNCTELTTVPEPPLEKVAVKQIGGKNGYQITILSNIEAQKKNLARFSAVGVNRATYRALNKTGNKTVTLLKRDISNTYNLAQKEFKNDLSLQQANSQRLNFIVRGTGKKIPVIKVKGAKKQTPLGVRINTGTSKFLKGHFIATMESGHTGVFRRKDNAKHKPRKNLSTGKAQKHGLGITERTFPSIAHMVANDERGDRMFLFVRQEYPKQLFAQLNTEADRAGASKTSSDVISALT